MREILFRGKRIDNGEWVYGHFAKHPSPIQIGSDYSPWYIFVPPRDPDDDGGWYNVDPDTVGQYTGLTDKDGKRIFEGDIVKFAKNIYQIIFDVGSFALYDEQGEIISKIGGNNDHCFSLMDLYIECCWEDRCASDIEVIGNIHDDPELLKGGAE